MWNMTASDDFFRLVKVDNERVYAVVISTARSILGIIEVWGDTQEVSKWC